MRDYWLSRAIRICGSQKELARRMGVKPDKVSYLLNSAKRIALEDVLLIENATNGLVTRHHLADRIHSRIKDQLTNEKTSTELRISERAALGIAYEKGLGYRKGARSDLSPRENFPQVKGRTAEIAARRYDFNNYKTYQQAKQVVDQGTVELIQAMDERRIAISTAALLTHLSENEQYQVLQLCKKDIITHAKQIKQLKKQVR